MRTKRAVVAVSVAAVVGLVPMAAFARGGADDPKNHDARDDRAPVAAVADGRGQDDPKHHDAGDDRGRVLVAIRLDDRSGQRGRNGHDNPATRDANDDRGRHEAEPGDDRGGAGETEPGDDHGGHGNEPGDDRRGGDDRGHGGHGDG